MISVEKNTFKWSAAYDFDEKYCKNSFKIINGLINVIDDYKNKKLKNDSSESLKDLLKKYESGFVIKFSFNDLDGTIIDQTSDLLLQDFKYNNLDINKYNQSVVVKIIVYASFYHNVEKYINGSITQSELVQVLRKMYLEKANNIINRYYQQILKEILTNKSDFVEKFVFKNKMKAITSTLLFQIPELTRNEVINYHINTPITDQSFYSKDTKIIFLGLNKNLKIVSSLLKDENISNYQKGNIIHYIFGVFKNFNETEYDVEIIKNIANILLDNVEYFLLLKEKNFEFIQYLATFNSNILDKITPQEISFETVFKGNNLQYDGLYENNKIIISDDYLNKIHFYENKMIYHKNILCFKKLLMNNNNLIVNNKKRFIKQIEFFIERPELFKVKKETIIPMLNYILDHKSLINE